MAVFILPWSLLIVKLTNSIIIREKYKKEIQFIYVVMFLVIISHPVLSFTSSVKRNDTAKYYFKSETPISTMVLNKKQKEYYDNVYLILKEYNYIAKDLIFATQLDHMTITAFSATPCGIFFQPMDFLADVNKSNLKKPDFIFLTKFDLTLISDTLKLQKWSFPEEFDQYLVGTPETYETGYSTERTLFCRKTRKIIK